MIVTRFFRSDYQEMDFVAPFDNAVCIPLTKGTHCLIDSEDYDKIYNFSWFAKKRGGGAHLGQFYA